MTAKPTQSGCNLFQLLAADRHAFSILFQLHTMGAQRFGELAANLHLNTRTLTQRLRKLEQCGLVIRTAQPSIPPCVSYRLSVFGNKLMVRIDPVLDWLARAKRPVALPPHDQRGIVQP